jgi:hypothetical protein
MYKKKIFFKKKENLQDIKLVQTTHKSQLLVVG